MRKLRKFPVFVLSKVRDYLARFSGVRVRVGTVRNSFVAKGLNFKGRRERHRKIMPAWGFERARVSELWQSDIANFLIVHHSHGIYLKVFLDDYSRYVVSGCYLQQKQDIIIETLLDGIKRFWTMVGEARMKMTKSRRDNAGGAEETQMDTLQELTGLAAHERARDDEGAFRQATESGKKV